MIKAVAKPSLLFRLGAWICTCMRSSYLPDELIAQIRPWRLFGLACWCDRTDDGATPPGTDLPS